MKNKKEALKIIGTIVFTLAICIFICFYHPAHFIHPDFDYIDLSTHNFNDTNTFFICNVLNIQDASPDNVHNITIKIPHDTKDLAFILPQIFTEFRFYINGSLVYEQTSDENDTIAYPQTNQITYRTDTNMLILQFEVESFDNTTPNPYTNPIPLRAFAIATPDALYHYEAQKDIVNYLIITFFLISFIFHLMVFVYRPQKIAHLYFSILTFSILIGFVFNNAKLSLFLLSDIPLTAGLRCVLVASATKIITILFYVKSQFKLYYSSLPYHIILYITGIVLIITMLAPVNILLYCFPAFHILSLICIIWAIYVTMRTYIHKQSDFFYYNYIGFLLLFIGFFSETILLLFQANITSLLPYSMILFIILQTLALTHQYQLTLDNVRNISVGLKNSIYELQNNKSTYISSHIKPNFLYETLESINRYNGKNLEKTDRLIQALASYLRQSLDFSVQPQEYSLHAEIKNCKAFAYLIKEQHPEIRIEFHIDEHLPEITLPQSSILALMENSVLYAFGATLQPRIDIYITADENEVKIQINDNGIGMSEEKIHLVLNYPNEHLSIGLYHINQYLIDQTKHGLLITCPSKKGTHIAFTLPIVQENQHA